MNERWCSVFGFANRQSYTGFISCAQFSQQVANFLKRVGLEQRKVGVDHGI